MTPNTGVTTGAAAGRAAPTRSTRSARSTRSVRSVLVPGVVVVTGLLGACGGDEPSDTGREGPGTTGTTTTPAGFDIDPSVPDDPGTLVACDTLDTPGDRIVPPRWWPSALPDRLDVAVAGTTLRAAAPPPGAGIEVLVATDGDRVRAETVVTHAALDEPGAPPADVEPDTTLRGVPAELATAEVGPGGVVTARWVEDDRLWTVEAAGVDEDELTALVERLELRVEDRAAAVDPTDEFRQLAAAPGRFPVVRTEIGLVAPGASPREEGVVVEEHDGGSGLPIITGLVPRTGLELGQLDGRPALRGELGTSRVLMTTTSDGAAVYAYGALDADELDEVVGSLERVDPDDDRLVGVPMDWMPAEGRFCRDDR